MNARTRILAVVLAIVAVVVIGDQLLSSRSGSDDASALSARHRYLDAAQLVAQKRALIAGEDQIRAALDKTRGTWDQVRATLVTAPSAGIAEAQFRDEVLEFVKRRRIEEAKTGEIESKPIGNDERLRLIRLPLNFASSSTREVYELIDGLEHMRDLVTRVASIEIVGPGRIPKDPKVSVSIELQAIAYVEGEGDG